MIGIFGLELTSIPSSYIVSEVPYVIHKCIAELNHRGLSCEGLYRISGSTDEVENLKLTMDKDGPNVNLADFNVHLLAGVFKLYLRVLPVPLITSDAQTMLRQAVGEC